MIRDKGVKSELAEKELCAFSSPELFDFFQPGQKGSDECQTVFSHNPVSSMWITLSLIDFWDLLEIGHLFTGTC